MRLKDVCVSWEKRINFCSTTTATATATARTTRTRIIIIVIIVMIKGEQRRQTQRYLRDCSLLTGSSALSICYVCLVYVFIFISILELISQSIKRGGSGGAMGFIWGFTANDKSYREGETNGTKVKVRKSRERERWKGNQREILFTLKRRWGNEDKTKSKTKTNNC